MRTTLRTLLVNSFVTFCGVVFATTPIAVTTANVYQTGFTVVWFSNTAETGFISVGTTSANVNLVAYDVRGAGVIDKIHMVNVTGLVGNTSYYVSIQSGSTFDNNNGGFYTVRTNASTAGFSPGALSITDVYKYMTTSPVTGESIIFGKAVRAGEESLPFVLLFKKGNNTPPYESYFLFANFVRKDGTFFGALATTDAIVINAWTAAEGFGGFVTVNAVNGTSLIVSLNQLAPTQSVPDAVPPSPVTGLTFASGINQIILQWTPSTSNNNAGTYVVRKLTGYPTSPTDGVVVLAGAGSSAADAVTAGITAYYAVYAYNSSGVYSTPVTGSGVALGQGAGTLIDNFENGTGQNQLGYYWYVFNDAATGSTINWSIVNSGAAATLRSAKAFYTIDTLIAGAYVALATDLTINTSVKDISAYTGLEFYAMGSSYPISVVLRSGANADFADYSYTFTPSNAGFTKYVIPFSSFAQPVGWGVAVPLMTSLQNMKALQFKATSTAAPANSYIQVDELRLVTQDLTPPAAATNVSFSILADAPLSVRVSWTNPALDYFGTVVVRRTDRFPTSISDGTVIINGASTQINDNTMLANTMYYFTVFTYDLAGNVSSATNKNFYFSSGGGLQAGWLDVSQNVFVGSKLLQSNDYVDSVVTLLVPVHTSLISANALATLNISGAISKTVTFNPAVTDNVVTVSLTLPVGTDILNIVAQDWDGNLSNQRTIALRVAAASDGVSLKAGSTILPYPAPYNPDAGNLTVAYELNKAANMEIYIYNLAGRLLSKVAIASGAEGAKSGYNEVTLAGVDAFGQSWSNGVNILRLVSNKQVIGTSKILVIR